MKLRWWLTLVCLLTWGASLFANAAPVFDPVNPPWIHACLAVALGLIGVISGIAWWIYRINRRLTQRIVESQQAEHTLRTLSIAIEQSPTSVVITDLDAMIQYVNPRFTQVTGYAAAEVMGKNAKILNSGLTPKATFEAMWRQLSRGELWSGEIINRRKNGQIYWEEAHICPVKDSSGQTTQYVAVKLDISERKQAEQYEKSRNRVLELLARGAALPVILEAIVQGVEESNPGMLCSILQMDSDGQCLLIGASPSLPDFYNTAIHGLKISSCIDPCAMAAFTGERVIVEDIEHYPDWADFKALAAQASWRSCWSEPIRSASGQVLGTFAIYHHQVCQPTEADLRLLEQSANLAAIAIDRSLALEALRTSEEQYRLLAENATDVIWTIGLDGRFTYISPSVEKLRGYTVAEAMQQSLEESLTPESAAMAKSELVQSIKMIQNGQSFPDYRGEFEQPCKEGSTVLVEITTTGLYNASGEFVSILGVSRDITERKRIQDRIAHLAHHDALTDLPNRVLFSDRLEQALAQVQRNFTGLAILFIDLDKFKPINDTLGHAVGDLMLKETAARLCACVRSADTVGRIGGDEFVVLLPMISHPQDALLVAEKIRHALNEPFELAGHCLSISSSIGVAIAPEHGMNEIELAKHADMAMYHAKEAGRNNVKLFQPEMLDAQS